MRKPRTLDQKMARKIFHKIRYDGEFPETGEAAWFCKECALKRACKFHRYDWVDGCGWGRRWDDD